MGDSNYFNIPRLVSTAKVTRLEVIDHREPLGAIGEFGGRVYGAHDCKVDLDLQDDGRTLKVFISGDRKVAPRG